MNIELINFLSEDRQLQMETLGWRNAPHVASYFQIKSIDAQTHARWLDSLAVDTPRTVAYFIKYDNRYIGVTYFHSINYSCGCADWGIYIYDESLRGRGLGKVVMRLCFDVAKDMGFHTLYLEVLKGNKNAISLYQKMGFSVCEEKDGVLRFSKSLL